MSHPLSALNKKHKNLAMCVKNKNLKILGNVHILRM